MSPQRQEAARVRVAAAGLDDVGEARARLSRTLLDALGLKTGQPIRISAGEHSVLLHAYPAGAEDDGLYIVRLDGTQRRKLGVDVGDIADVQRYDGRTAQRVELVAVGDLTEVELPMDEIRQALAERPVVVDDTVKVTPTRKTFDVQVNVLGLNVAGVTGAVNDADGVVLRVAETTPPGVVMVDEKTRIEIRHAGTAVTDEGSTHTEVGQHE
jgi:transitional endoplasmic reticulum ATPase